MKQDWRACGRVRTSSRAAGEIRGRRLTLWSSVQAPGLVEFLLHPIPHSGTRRRLFPCELHREASRFVTPGWLQSAAGAQRPREQPILADELQKWFGACRFEGDFCESTTWKL